MAIIIAIAAIIAVNVRVIPMVSGLFKGQGD
jgi:hypothetical protein